VSHQPTNDDNSGPPAAFRSRLLLVGAGVTLFAIGQALVFIIVAPLARTTGLTEMQFGVVLTLASLPLVAAAPYWGRLSDRAGRKPIFLIGLFGSAIGTAVVALALQARLWGWLSTGGLMVALLAARALYSATSSAIYPAAGGYIADVTDFRTRGQGMSLLGAANSLGAVLAPLVALPLTFAGALAPMYVTAVLTLAGGLGATILLKEPARHRPAHTAGGTEAARLRATDPRLRPYLAMWCAFFLTFSSIQIITGFYIQDRLGITEPAAVVRTASFCLMSMAVVITFIQAVVFQAARVPPPVQLRLCGPLFVAALLLMAWAATPLALMGAFAVLGGSFACATPGINGSASLSVEPHQQGTASGYLAAATTVGAILGPLVGTVLYRIAPSAVMLAGAALFCAMSVYAFTVRVPARR
jgi:MFS family permease